MRRRMYGALAGIVSLAGLVLIAQAFSTSGGTRQLHVSKLALAESAEATPGEGPAGTIDEYLAAQRAYPAEFVPPAVAARAEATFEAIAKKDAKNGDPKAEGHKWKHYGPKVTRPSRACSSSRAPRTHGEPARRRSRSPDCGKNRRLVPHLGRAAGGGVWRTDDATRRRPRVEAGRRRTARPDLGRRHRARPERQGADTLYLGTGEPNHCSSGCEAGVGIYRSTTAATLDEARGHVRHNGDVRLHDARARTRSSAAGSARS